MNCSLIWNNLRSVNAEQAFERVVILSRQKHFNITALLEPFQHHRNIDMYRLWLNMGTTSHKLKGETWLFTEDRFQMEVQIDIKQLLSFKLTDNDDGQETQVTIVYASTNRHTRIA